MNLAPCRLVIFKEVYQLLCSQRQICSTTLKEVIEFLISWGQPELGHNMPPETIAWGSFVVDSG